MFGLGCRRTVPLQYFCRCQLFILGSTPFNKLWTKVESQTKQLALKRFAPFPGLTQKIRRYLHLLRLMLFTRSMYMGPLSQQIFSISEVQISTINPLPFLRLFPINIKLQSWRWEEKTATQKEKNFVFLIGRATFAKQLSYQTPWLPQKKQKFDVLIARIKHAQ